MGLAARSVDVTGNLIWIQDEDNEVKIYRDEDEKIREEIKEENQVYGRMLFKGSGPPIFDAWETIYPTKFRRVMANELKFILKEYVKEESEKCKNGNENGDKDAEGLKNAIEKRLNDFERCGAVIRVRTCECCGTDRPGSGSFAGTRRTCKMATCPTCGWVRAKKAAEFYKEAEKILDGSGPPGSDYLWQFVTFTSKYDPSKPADLTWRSLRERAVFLSKEISLIWNKELKAKGTALFRSIECSVSGHIHAHALYYGPSINDKELSEKAKKLCGDRTGYIHRKPIEEGDQMGNRLPIGDQIARAVRYMAKGLSVYGCEFDEGHHGMEGDAIVMMNPRLAARWAMATSWKSIRLTQRFGAFRGLDIDPGDYSYEPPQDGEVACESCGTVGEWKDSFRQAEAFIQDCHAKYKKAMECGSKWIPYWMRKKYGYEVGRNRTE